MAKALKSKAGVRWGGGGGDGTPGSKQVRQRCLVQSEFQFNATLTILLVTSPWLATASQKFNEFLLNLCLCLSLPLGWCCDVYVRLGQGWGRRHGD